MSPSTHYPRNTRSLSGLRGRFIAIIPVGSIANTAVEQSLRSLDKQVDTNRDSTEVSVVTWNVNKGGRSGPASQIRAIMDCSPGVVLLQEIRLDHINTYRSILSQNDLCCTTTFEREGQDHLKKYADNIGQLIA